jgi:hypothetical protein
MEDSCMKQSVKALLFVMSIILMFSNCKNEDKLLKSFYVNEKTNLINITNELLSKLGLENFEVIVYTHKSINNRVISKSMSDTNWNGSSFNPEPLENIYTEVFKDMSNMYGYMRQRTLVANYELNAKREISYENFSIMIIMENINQRQKDELLKIIDSNILNIERGDTIFIISKDEFNKLE